MNVGVVGLGLMGGSLARALKASADPPRILGADSAESRLADALEAGAVDVAEPDAARVVATADVVVYATPLDTTLDLLARHRSLWRPDALVMDLVSLKLPVLNVVTALNAGSQWIGAHPMAGGERSGFVASRADLFQGATVWLSATDEPHPMAGRASSLWTSLGATCRWIDAAVHDRRMLVASHLPQVAANALAALVAEAGLSRSDLGPGGRDMTRLAGSSPSLWRGLLEASGPELAPLVRELASRLDTLSRDLETGDLEALESLMGRTRRWKEDGQWS